MIFELTSLHVNSDSLEQFNVALPEALGIIRGAEGHLGHKVDQSVNDPCRYLLVVQWTSKQEAIDRFRETGRMKQMRYLLNGFYDQPAKSLYFNDYELTPLKSNVGRREADADKELATPVATC